MTRHSQDLCESLKMQNNKACYKRMRLDILEMARKHLDPENSCSSQIKAVQALMAELVTKWPDFFGGKDTGNAQALKRAMAYIRQNHSASRSRKNLSKHATKRGTSRARSVARMPKKSNRTANAKVLVKQEQPTDLTQTPLVERMTCNLEYYASQVPPSTPAESSGQSAPITPGPSGWNRALRPRVELTASKPKPSTATKPGLKTTTTLGLPTRLNMLQTAPHSQSFSEPTSSLPYASSSQASQPQSFPFGSTHSLPSPMASTSHHMNVQSIHQFLRTCLPPMDHFLHRFINAGLRTEEGLLGASRWRRELVESFLDQLPPHPDGSPVLLMEKLVLMHQFATYFL